MNHRIDQTERLDRALILMARHVDTWVDVNKLAKAAGLSRYYFLRIFRREMGVTPIRHYMALKFLEARRLIMDMPKVPITDIPGMVGLESVGQFSASFRKRFGIPPSWVRRPRCLCLAVGSDLHSGAKHTHCGWRGTPCMQCHTCRSTAAAQVTV